MKAQARLRVMTLDLQDLASVTAFATRFNSEVGRLDVLMNNAGIMSAPHGLTRDGFERQMGTNHLGHFALTGHLLNALKNTPGSRVVTVSSSGHRAGTMNFDDLLFTQQGSYAPMRAYGRSKLANLLFAYELQRRFETHGVDCISVAAHPGAAQTNLGRHIENNLFFRVFKPLLVRIVPDPAAGALSQLRAAVDASVRGGEYYGPGGCTGMSGAPVRVKSSKASHNTHDAAKLWDVSERLTGVSYSFS